MKVLAGLLSALMIGLFTYGYLDLQQQIQSIKVSVINMEELYLTFDMTKEMENKYKHLSKESMLSIDSLNQLMQNLKLQNSDVNATLVSQKLQLAALNKANLQQQNEYTKLELEQQIWNQLNQYLFEFGQQNPHAIIFGAQGDGNILYAGETVDITAEAIEFVNSKYRGI